MRKNAGRKILQLSILWHMHSEDQNSNNERLHMKSSSLQKVF
jgi:hypothetical protein